MNYGKPKRFRREAASFSFLAALLLSACQGDLPEVPTQEEFTKQKLETLGDLLRPGVAEQFQFLPELPPFDTSVYWYLQTLYNQATSAMRLDKQSPPHNRWSQDRAWRVFIIKNSAQRHAFTLPGGDFFITTGMLQSFQKEYELYSLMAFEAVLMNEGHLLKRLVREYNSLTVSNIIEGAPTASGVTADSIAARLPGLAYEADAVEEADGQAGKLVCATSVFDPKGLGPFLLNPAFENSDWLLTRPSYGGRLEVLGSPPSGSCGGLKGNGSYQHFVLNVLD